MCVSGSICGFVYIWSALKLFENINVVAYRCFVVFRESNIVMIYVGPCLFFTPTVDTYMDY